MSEERLFQITKHGDVTVLHPAVTVDERIRIIEFADHLTKFVEENKPDKLQINFEYVKIFVSEGISALIRAQRRVNQYGGKMNLCGMTEDLRKIFKICRLDGTVFDIYDSCRDATAALED